MGWHNTQRFDCSGYVQYLYKKHNINLPRTAWAQSKRGVFVEKENLAKRRFTLFSYRQKAWYSCDTCWYLHW